MNWQDIVIAVGTVIIVLGVLPSIFSDDKPALATCAITATIVFIFALTFLTLELWFTATVNLANTTVWTILTVQQIRRRHRYA